MPDSLATELFNTAARPASPAPSKPSRLAKASLPVKRQLPQPALSEAQGFHKELRKASTRKNAARNEDASSQETPAARRPARAPKTKNASVASDTRQAAEASVAPDTDETGQVAQPATGENADAQSDLPQGASQELPEDSTGGQRASDGEEPIVDGASPANQPLTSDATVAEAQLLSTTASAAPAPSDPTATSLALDSDLADPPQVTPQSPAVAQAAAISPDAAASDPLTDADSDTGISPTNVAKPTAGTSAIVDELPADSLLSDPVPSDAPANATTASAAKPASVTGQAQPADQTSTSISQAPATDQPPTSDTDTDADAARATIAITDDANDPDAGSRETATPRPTTPTGQATAVTGAPPDLSATTSATVADVHVAGRAATPTHTAPAVGTPGAEHAAGTPERLFAQANHANIVAAVRSELLPRGGTMHIRLDPPELGALQVTVHMRDGVVAASFQAANGEAAQLLSHSLGDLRQLLESQGVIVDKLQVQHAPRQEPPSRSGSDEQQQQQRHTQDNPAQQEQQRREMLRRMWRRLSRGQDPLDVLG